MLSTSSGWALGASVTALRFPARTSTTRRTVGVPGVDPMPAETNGRTDTAPTGISLPTPSSAVPAGTEDQTRVQAASMSNPPGRWAPADALAPHPSSPHDPAASTPSTPAPQARLPSTRLEDQALPQPSSPSSTIVRRDVMPTSSHTPRSESLTPPSPSSLLGTHLTGAAISTPP